MNSQKKIIIIGGGPAGLFCSSLLLKEGFQVDLYDQASNVGKKFLVAGNGGLNLTHSEGLKDFANRYRGQEERFFKLLNEFSPADLRDWFDRLGAKTFIGSSGRVFPEKLKSAEILSNWLDKLKAFKGFHLHTKHSFLEIDNKKNLVFEHNGAHVRVSAKTIIFALGGKSWKKTGSDGKWLAPLENLGVKVNTFLPMNCGFETNWGKYFQKNVDHHGLKNIKICFKDKVVKGEVMLTPYGIEGGAIYALSGHIRDEIIDSNHAIIQLDLKPDLSVEQIIQKLKLRRPKVSLSNYLRKSLGIDKKTFILLKELNLINDDPCILAQSIKSVSIKLIKSRPIDEAISTSGGVMFGQLTENLELKESSGIYFVGEMLDFEAPTGGYLLQACFSTSFKAVMGIVKAP